MKLKTACPISKTQIDGNVARLNGFFSLVLLVAGYLCPLLWLFLLLDFIIRSFKVKYSPVARVSKSVLNLLHVKPNPINFAPKKFAARIGLLMSVFLNLFLIFDLSIGVYIVLGMFCVATALEAFFDYCLGCKAYSVLITLGAIKAK